MVLKWPAAIDDDVAGSCLGGSCQEVHPMPERNVRLDDDQAHQRALEFLAELLGEDCTDRVCWDLDHHLQGHVDVHGQHVVVIAPRDDDHAPLVLSEDDWDALRRGLTVSA
jgi:hypothetical protein